MSLFGDILGAASKLVGGLVGGGDSPVASLIDKAGDALGGVLGDITGDKLGDKIGDVVGNVVGSDALGDKVGDLLGGAIGGETKVGDFLASKGDAIGDTLGDLFGSDKAGDVVGSVLGGLDDVSAAPADAMVPRGISGLESAEMPDMIEVSDLAAPDVAGELQYISQPDFMPVTGFDEGLSMPPEILGTLGPGDIQQVGQELMI